MKKIIKISLLLLLFIPFISVNADNVDVTQVGYGYYYYDTNLAKHTVNWSGYDANYKYRGLLDFPTTYQDEGIYVVDFGIRFHIDGNFKANKKYSLTFNWINYASEYSSSSATFLQRFSAMTYTLHCRETSWTSTGYDESHCFSSSEFVVSPGADSDSAVTITWYFTPKVDFYTGIIYYFHSSSSNTSYISEGWEINNITWTDVTNDTQNIINNQNQNTQNIINNQNQNTQEQINSQKVCKNIDVTNIKVDNKYLTNTGAEDTSTNYGITDFINVTSGTIKTIVGASTGTSPSLCFYNVNKVLISCIRNNSLTVGSDITIPLNSTYVKFSIRKSLNEPQFNVCTNGNQAVTDTLTDDNVSESISDSSNFFSGFTTETYGLTGVITAPLNVIQSITSKTCSPLVLPLPFVNQNLTLPCMGEIYSQYFGSFLTIYQTITFGIVAYWVVVRIFNLVKDFKNPDHDEIEVLDL